MYFGRGLRYNSLQVCSTHGKELDQDAKLSFIWNLFAAEANAKKEASTLNVLEA
ncbi:hypothetical protein DSO57_1022565 [Entomophthora muscae]|uniref:Uncharacterized protein n=1 Tax=Entomophthora muscae TaxID=34485 RepID=A0ACC2U1M0_9FUNG|nr:hypothetical protein DSO57_1022565 [Entomophthora muscae]